MRPWLPHDAAQFSTTLRPLPDLTGDFARTLRACEKLLNDHSHFRRNPAGFVDNVKWWMGVEGEVEKLKERIRFHTTKVRESIKFAPMNGTLTHADTSDHQAGRAVSSQTLLYKTCQSFQLIVVQQSTSL